MSATSASKYREMLLTTPKLNEHISGAILYDETKLRQIERCRNPSPFPCLAPLAKKSDPPWQNRPFSRPPSIGGRWCGNGAAPGVASDSTTHKREETMSATDNNNKTTRQARLRKILLGIDKHFPNVTSVTLATKPEM